MTGLKVGASLADGAPKVWHGSAFVAPKRVSVWTGTEYAEVWPGFSRQRMNKSGNWQSGSNFEFVTVTGWSADATYPALVASHRLVVGGQGTATVHAWLDSQTDDDPINGAVYLMHNNVTLARANLTGYQNRSILEMTVPDVTFTEGDTIWLQTKTGSSINAKVYAGSYLEVYA